MSQQQDVDDLDMSDLNDLDTPDRGDLDLPDLSELDVSELPIGRRVRYWRLRKGMTQRLLGELVGKSKSWVEKVEGGARPLDSVWTICCIADVLKIDPLLLLGHPDRDRGAASHPPQPPAAFLDLGAAHRDVDLLIYRHLKPGHSNLNASTRHLRALLTVTYAAMAAEAVPLTVRCKVISTVLSRYGGFRR